jgi:hypothetical protein
MERAAVTDHALSELACLPPTHPITGSGRMSRIKKM